MRHLSHLIIRGRVQGVSFRAWAARQAQSRGVDGWVRNREDGGVEAIVAGDSDWTASSITTQEPRISIR